jgi:hypothetical protein
MPTSRLALPTYAVALLLVLFPLFDVGQTVAPFRPGAVDWRFNAVGLFSRSLIPPMLGLALAVWASVLYEHRTTQRAIAIGSGVLAATTIMVLLLFLLDALQMRTQMPPAAQSSLVTATAFATFKFALVAFILAAFSRALWRNPRRAKPHPRESAEGTQSERAVLGISD